MTRTELLDRLEAITDVAVPPPAARFVDELERRLLDRVGDDYLLDAVGADGPASVLGPRRTVTALGGVAAALVLVVGLALATLEEATVSVTTPATAAPSTGRELPSDVDMPLARGDDEVDVDVGATAATSGDDGVPSVAGAERSTAASAAAANTERAAPPPGSWQYSEPSSERFLLEAEAAPTGSSLRWERYEGAEFFAYIVLRATDGADPEYPRRDSSAHQTEFVHRSKTRGDTTWSDTSPMVTGEARYLVVVFDQQGAELARSNVAAAAASFGLMIKLP